MKLCFGDITFDSGRRLLLRGPETIHVSPRAFQLLGLLLSRRPDAVSKAEIMQFLWPDTVVVEGNLTALVNEIRLALEGKGRGSKFIRTVHGFGYAFEGAATQVDSGAVPRSPHRLFWGQQEIPLANGPSLIGRMQEAAIWIAHASVSREHARIWIDGVKAEIEDLGSKNGTWIGTERISSRVQLADGNEIRVGSVTLRYRSPFLDVEMETPSDLPRTNP